VKLYYHRCTPPNVGDELNAMLWPRHVPDLDVLDAADWLVGAGTILDGRLDALRGTKLVMGAGVRCDSTMRRVGSDVRIAGVRGRLSARWLGLPDTAAMGDPGFLVALWREGGPDSGRVVGLVPHLYSLQWSTFTARARDAGLEIVSPTLPVVDFLRQLGRCERVFCESLHGAILAEAMRIPWARVRLCAHHYEGPGVSEFKWRDAFSVLDADVTSVNAMGLAPVKRAWPVSRHLVRPVQQVLERRLAGVLGRLRDEAEVFHLVAEERLWACVDRILAHVTRLRARPRTGVFL